MQEISGGGWRALFPSVPEDKMIATEPSQNEQKIYGTDSRWYHMCQINCPNKSFLYNPQLCRKVETDDSLPMMTFKRKMLLLVT